MQGCSENDDATSFHIFNVRIGNLEIFGLMQEKYLMQYLFETNAGCKKTSTYLVLTVISGATNMTNNTILEK
jgi:hypothetical protein